MEKGDLGRYRQQADGCAHLPAALRRLAEQWHRSVRAASADHSRQDEQLDFRPRAENRLIDSISPQGPIRVEVFQSDA